MKEFVKEIIVKGAVGDAGFNVVNVWVSRVIVGLNVSDGREVLVRVVRLGGRDLESGVGLLVLLPMVRISLANCGNIHLGIY